MRWIHGCMADLLGVVDGLAPQRAINDVPVGPGQPRIRVVARQVAIADTTWLAWGPCINENEHGIRRRPY